MIRVLLVDDEELVRSGFRMILDFEDDLTVVGEASDGRAAIELAERAMPDVILMDIQMPRLDGLAATRAIIDAKSSARIVILTTFDRDDYLYDALAAGASGFLLKNAPSAQLLMAVRVVANGEGLLSPQVTSRVIGRFVATRQVESPRIGSHNSPRVSSRCSR